MIEMSVTGLEQAITALQKQSKALVNLEPAYKRCAAEYVKRTDDAFQNERGYDGETYEPLAQSTIDKRIGNLKAANKRGKSGKLTKGAQRFRERLKSPGGIKPLIDTARARNSVHATSSREGIEWSAVGYLGFHMGGATSAGRSRTVTIPVRNPTPFYWSGDEWKLRESARKTLEEHIKRHVYGVAT